MKRICVLDVDDLSPSHPGLDIILKLKEHYPGFKITCFTPACDKSSIKAEKAKEWVELLKKFPWIEICPHGFVHLQGEMVCSYKEAKKNIKMTEKVFNGLGLPFQKIWKSPFWQTSVEAYKALMDSGYVVAVDKNQEKPIVPGLKTYVFNKSLEEIITPNETLIKYHGHVAGRFYNDVSVCLPNLMAMPTDLEFLTISEYLKIYGPEKI